MTDKRTQVIEAAIRLFAWKGVHATSIQEIADAAGIAKGSMYLHFKSKDDLLLNVYQTFFGRIFSEISEAGKGVSSPREQLAVQIRVQLEKLLEFRDFIKMQMREMYIHENKEIKRFALENRMKAFHLMQERIISLYGDECRPWSLDCTNLFESMITAYMGIMISHTKVFDLQEVTEFLLGRLDDLVYGLMKSKPAPLLRQEDLDVFVCTEGLQDEQELVRKLLGELREAVNQLPPSAFPAEDLLSSLQVLEEELAKSDPKRVIVQGMLGMLMQSGQEGLQKPLRQLQQLAASIMEQRKQDKV